MQNLKWMMDKPPESSGEDDASIPVQAHRQDVHYVGFWARLWAFVVDTVVFTLIVIPPVLLLFGDKLYGMFLLEMERVITRMPPLMQTQIEENYPWLVRAMADPQLAEIPPNLNLLINIFSAVLIAILILIFWKTRCATPGKMILNAVIVDAATLAPASNTQLIVRYVGYYIVVFFTLCIGFFMIGWTKRKQGLHDFLARTVVIKELK